MLDRKERKKEKPQTKEAKTGGTYSTRTQCNEKERIKVDNISDGAIQERRKIKRKRKTANIQERRQHTLRFA